VGYSGGRPPFVGVRGKELVPDEPEQEVIALARRSPTKDQQPPGRRSLKRLVTGLSRGRCHLSGMRILRASRRAGGTR